MLIRQAALSGALVDLRVNAVVEAVAPHLEPRPGEAVLDAHGGELLPGLHDHHIHIYAAAAAATALDCQVGPGNPERGRERLAERIAEHPGQGWVRGINYHEQQLGELDRWMLDAMCSNRPLRIQHRSGKVWVCNSLALSLLGFAAGDTIDGLEVDAQGRLTGRLVRGDTVMAQRLRAIGESVDPDVQALSQQLARFGIVGLTDTSASNGIASAENFRLLQAQGTLLQHVQVMGNDELETGYLKILLDEDRLPPLDHLVQRINGARLKGRNVAFHCVTHLELVFALAGLADAAPPEQGFDRIEHGAMVNDEMARRLAQMDMPVITQPGFLYAKGDQYLQDLSRSELGDLYRFRGLREQGVQVVASSDAPYGPISPWQVSATAMDRKTTGGAELSPWERVEPEVALSGYLTPPAQLNQRRAFEDLKAVRVGSPADLCLLGGRWQDYRQRPEEVAVRATLIGGSVVYDSGSGD